jgi:hypothetical protein
MKFSTEVLEDHTKEVSQIKKDTNLLISKEGEMLIKIAELEGQVEDWKLKLRAKDR